WPNAERFGICPWRDEILDGLLGSSTLGFQTQFHAHNFFDSIDRYLEARIDRDDSAVLLQGRRTLVRSYPISVEWPSRWVPELGSPAVCRESAFRQLGLAPDA